MAAQTITKVPYVDNETVIGASNLNAIQDAVNDHASLIDGLDSNKVDKVPGKGLSTNDFNNDAQSKLNNLPSGPELDTSLGQKVDKRTSGTEVYTHSGSTQGGATLTETPTAGAVPQYGTDGVLKAGAPVATNDVVRKAELDEVVDEMSDSTTGLNSKAPAIYETVSGAIASFADGADGMPFKKLVANIEPVQDLHGYEKPWPAGGGENILDLEAYISSRTTNYTVDKDGWITINSLGAANLYVNHWSVGELANRSAIILIDSARTTATNINLRLYAGNTAVSNVTSKDENRSFDNIGFNWTNDGSATVKVAVVNAPTISQWTPYSNICPISGWTGAEIKRAAKNLVQFAESYSVAADTPWLNLNCHLKPGTYVFSYNPSVTSGLVTFNCYDADNNRIVSVPGIYNSDHSVTFTVDKDVYRIGSYSNSALTISDCMIRLASDTNETFEPYQGNQISVTFPTSAGTVYGGTLTINPDRTGKLKVDKAIYSYNFPLPTNTDSKNRWELASSLPNVYSELIGKQWSIPVDASITNNLPYKNEANANEGEATYSLYGHNSSVEWRIRIPNTYTASEAQAIANTSVLCYPINPVTYALTASEISAILTTLYGTNNVWADVGTVEVTAPKDTKLYVDNHITQAIAAALNA